MNGPPGGDTLAAKRRAVELAMIEGVYVVDAAHLEVVDSSSQR